VEALSAPRRFTMEDMKSQQQDVVSPPARRFQALLKSSGARHAAAALALDWDGRLEASSAAAGGLFWIAWSDCHSPRPERPRPTTD
jgi:hypothetical protein